MFFAAILYVATGQSEVVALHLLGKFVDIESVRLGAILVCLDDDFLFLEALCVDISDAIDS